MFAITYYDCYGDSYTEYFETEEEMINRINYLEKDDDDLVDHIKTLEIK